MEEKKSFSINHENLHETVQEAMGDVPDIVSYRILQGKCASFLKDTSNLGPLVSYEQFTELIKQYENNLYIRNILEGVAQKHLSNALYEIRQACLEVVREEIISNPDIHPQEKSPSQQIEGDHFFNQSDK